MNAPHSGRGRTPSAMRSVAALSLAAGALLIAGPLAGAVEADEEVPADEPTSAVTITTTPSGVGAPCLPPLLALSNTPSNTDEAFTLRIDVSAPLCSPIDAAAVVYAMPDNGEAWPQTLLERVDFRLDVAGVTEVRFAKECDPVQFDVITGVSPQVISPLGEFHGPLLFPFDVSTSLQFNGDGSRVQPDVGHHHDRGHHDDGVDHHDDGVDHHDDGGDHHDDGVDHHDGVDDDHHDRRGRGDEHHPRRGAGDQHRAGPDHPGAARSSRSAGSGARHPAASQQPRLLRRGRCSQRPAPPRRRESPSGACSSWRAPPSRCWPGGPRADRRRSSRAVRLVDEGMTDGPGRATARPGPSLIPGGRISVPAAGGGGTRTSGEDAAIPRIDAQGNCGVRVRLATSTFAAAARSTSSS